MPHSANRQKIKRNYEILAESLHAILRFRRRSPTSVSEQAGLSLSAVNDILNLRIKNPSIDTLQRIAEVLGVSVAQLIGEGDIVISADLRILTVKVIGIAQGGVFVMPSAKRPKGLPREIKVPVDCDLPAGSYFALLVRGREMDAAKPKRIEPGDYAICRDFNETPQPLLDGRIYAIRRRLPDGSEETSLRRLVQRPRGYALLTESTDPQLAPEISAPADLDGDQNKSLFVLGRLVRTQQDHD
jgi:transcriptional regulator with XRE-family HTH domain